jgi:hypothetical protein
MMNNIFVVLSVTFEGVVVLNTTFNNISVTLRWYIFICEIRGPSQVSDKTDPHDIIEILLKVALSTTTPSKVTEKTTKMYLHY